MFRLAKSFDFARPIALALPSGESQNFRCRFRVLDEEDFAKCLADENDPDRVLLEAAVTTWEGIQTEKGETFPYSKSNLQRLIDIPFVKRALARAYVDGVRESLEKN